MMPTCPVCDGPTAGWMCAICGAEADEHDPNHLHVGSDRYCTLLCRNCGRPDVHCTCAG
jgi:hypothetical protein